MKDYISVIIPIYNSEKFLDKCIESVINQSYKLLEIILIDDGSTDSSSNICLKYKDLDKRIQYKKIENCGVSNARNKGIELSTGEYIYFMDSDDILYRNALEILVNNIRLHDVDLSACKIKNFVNEDELQFLYSNTTNIVDVEAFIDSVLIHKTISGYLFNKLFKREIINNRNVKFNTQYSICEDEAFIFDYVSNQTKFTINDSVIYGYRDNPNGALNSCYTEKKVSAVFAREHVYRRIKDLTNNKEIIMQECDNMNKTLVYNLRNILTSNIRDKRKYINEIKKIERKYRNDDKYFKQWPLKTKTGYFLLRIL